MTTDAEKVHDLLQALVGKSLPQLCVGVRDLQMRFEDDYRLQLEAAVRTGESGSIHPYSLDGLARLLPLLNREVTAVSVDAAGSLTLTVGATTIHCNAHEQYEAWNCNGPDNELIVSLPGGGLAVWSGRSVPPAC